ncbi:MAG: hypothetical protein U0174_20905 [Polyangiaceae bacterium]
MRGSIRFVERLHALWLLAIAFLQSIFGRRRGLAEFHESYKADRLAPVTEEERNVLPLLSGCIACGLCELEAGVRPSDGTYSGPMDLMLASSRSMPDYDAAVLSFAHLSDERALAVERICPARVPARRIAAFVRAKALAAGPETRPGKPEHDA